MTVTAADLNALADKAEEIMDQARAITVQWARYEAQFKGFHPHSTNRAVAEYVLFRAGEWVSRADVVAWTGASPGTLPTVAKRLAANGVQVERQVREGKAEYRVTRGVSEP